MMPNIIWQFSDLETQHAAIGHIYCRRIVCRACFYRFKIEENFENKLFYCFYFGCLKIGTALGVLNQSLFGYCTKILLFIYSFFMKKIWCIFLMKKIHQILFGRTFGRSSIFCELKKGSFQHLPTNLSSVHIGLKSCIKLLIGVYVVAKIAQRMAKSLHILAQIAQLSSGINEGSQSPLVEFV